MADLKLINVSTIDKSLLTVDKSKVMPGKTFIGPSGEIETGELDLADFTQDANAVEGDIALNKVGYSNGIKRVGTLPVVGNVSRTLNAGSTLNMNGIYSDSTISVRTLAQETPANGIASRILNGYYGYVNGSRITGTLITQPVTYFNASVVSAIQAACSWAIPSKGPYSGVMIRYNTGSYPANVNDGVQGYLGGGTYCNITGLKGSTTYYFSIFSYSIINGARSYSPTILRSAITTPTAQGSQTFTSSGTFTVPSGVTSVDIFVVAGGGKGGAGNDYGNNGIAGGGAGSGYTTTTYKYPVSQGQLLSVVVGAGSTEYSYYARGGMSNWDREEYGGTSSVSYAGTIIASATGGKSSAYSARSGFQYEATSGGSGGGGQACNSRTKEHNYGGNGGADGSNGAYNGWGTVGIGQGTTTRAFGEANNTLYAGAGGGGGGHHSQGASGSPGTGGAGGGGTGGWPSAIAGSYAGTGSAGVFGTGGGGGGGGSHWTNRDYIGEGGNGGSGIVIIRWGY